MAKFPNLRAGSPRPELLVGPRLPARIVDPNKVSPFPGSDTQLRTSVGRQAVTTVDGRPFLTLGFQRGRIVTALPLKDGPRLLVQPMVVHDSMLGYLADPDGNLIGVPGQWVNRIVSARWSEGIQRLTNG